jgi:hypothetical protein
MAEPLAPRGELLFFAANPTGFGVVTAYITSPDFP